MIHPVNVQAALLHMLHRGEGCGTELVARVLRATGGRIKFLPGSVYLALASMERKGWIERCPVPEGRGPSQGPARLYYRITPAGVRVADDHLRTIRAVFSMEDSP